MVTATDSTCDISGNLGGDRQHHVLHHQQRFQGHEFYVFGAGDRVMGEVENVGPV